MTTSRLKGGVLLAVIAPSMAAGQDAWSYRITPYLWAATVSGDIGAQDVEGSTESNYSFFALENLERYASLHFEARAERWGWFADGLVVEYEDRFDTPQRRTSLGLSGEILEAGALYELVSVAGLTALGGARVIDLEVEVAFAPGPSGRASDRWADPFIGLQYRRPFGERWYADVRGDIGGFGVSFEWQAQLIASVGYRYSDRLELCGGYRYLRGELDEQVLLDITAEGLGLGFGWSW